MSLLTLTPEVLHDVLLNLDAVDLSCLSQTCKALSVYADSEANPVLWRSLFHQLFDSLETSIRPGYSHSPVGAPVGVDYGRLVKERCRARGVIRSPHTDKKVCRPSQISRVAPVRMADLPVSDRKIKQREHVIRALHGIYVTADNRFPGKSKNAKFLSSLLSDRSSVADWLTPPRPNRPAQHPVDNEVDVDDDEDDVESQPPTILETETALDVPENVENTTSSSDSHANIDGDQDAAYSTRSVTKRRLSARKRVLDSPIDDPDVTSMICQLHMAGISMAEISWSSYKSGKAYREIVYKCSNFDERNHYGPFFKRDDGKRVVDWNMMNAVCQVMALNVRSAWHQVCSRKVHDARHR